MHESPRRARQRELAHASRPRSVVARHGLHTLVLAVIAGGTVAFAGATTPPAAGEGQAAATATLAAEQVDRADAQLVASRFEARSPVPGVAVELDVDGQRSEVTTVALTVADLLAEAGVVVDNDDLVSVPLSAAVEAGLSVSVTTVETRTEHVTETDAFETVEEADSTLLRGQRRVVTQGVDGVTATAFQVTTEGGEEAAREVVARAVRSERVDEVVRVGTRQPVAPRSSSSSSSASSSGSSSSSSSSVPADVWGSLAQCESGGNPSIISPNGLYHGLYQFSVATWRSVGGSGLPSEASVDEQTERAKALQARSGWGQWPACSSRLGLR